MNLVYSEGPGKAYGMGCGTLGPSVQMSKLQAIVEIGVKPMVMPSCVAWVHLRACAHFQWGNGCGLMGFCGLVEGLVPNKPGQCEQIPFYMVPWSLVGAAALQCCPASRGRRGGCFLVIPWAV